MLLLRPWQVNFLTYKTPEMKKLLLLPLLFLFLTSDAQNKLENCDDNDIVCKARSLESSKYNLLKTDYGYVQVGPANSSFAHFYTNMTKYFFNKDIWSRNGGFSSYGTSNLFLKTHGTTRVTILGSNGNMGIGTRSPSAKLEVNGDVKIKTDINVLGSASISENIEVSGEVKLNNLIQDSINDSQSILIADENGILKSLSLKKLSNYQYKEPKPCFPDDETGYPAPTWANKSGSSPSIYTGFNCPAKVGIGTANPNAALHVNSNAIIGTNLDVNNNLKVNNKLAIGTEIQDDYDLAVCGKIRATEVKVNAASEWCDYVFEEDYDLKSLKEVDAFIKKNKHLPEIPSAEVVNNEGIEVSAMMVLMMKKIEELTLYTIEQEKRINELEKNK